MSEALPLYPAVRGIFWMMFNVFFHVEVIGVENMPPDGQPTLLCANHSNSLTDAVAVVATVPPSKRKMVRLTAKDTFWQRNDPFSFLIRRIGTVPVKRRKDYGGEKVDNTESMKMIVECVEKGDCVCIFPEGISRYHPRMAPLKTGVAMLANEVLNRNRDREDFTVAILTASITYLHREKFRSACAVRYHPPIVLGVRDLEALASPVPDADTRAEAEAKTNTFEALHALTNMIEKQIRNDLLDAPNWTTLRIAHTARKLYAPNVGTRISLSGYVRLTKMFIDLLAPYVMSEEERRKSASSAVEAGEGSSPPRFKVRRVEQTAQGREPTVIERDEPSVAQVNGHGDELQELVAELLAYQYLLDQYHIKDHRVSLPKKLSILELAFRLSFRAFWACVLSAAAFPGVLLLFPMFLAIRLKEARIRRKGALEDNLDEIAQYKLLLALIIIPLTIGFICALTLPVAAVTGPATALLMWFTIRWIEDLMANLRALVSLLRIVKLDVFYKRMDALRESRARLAAKVHRVAVERCGLPDNPEELVNAEGMKNLQKGGYFSIYRRRKKDWNVSGFSAYYTTFPCEMTFD